MAWSGAPKARETATEVVMHPAPKIASYCTVATSAEQNGMMDDGASLVSKLPRHLALLALTEKFLMGGNGVVQMKEAEDLLKKAELGNLVLTEDIALRGFKQDDKLAHTRMEVAHDSDSVEAMAYIGTSLIKGRRVCACNVASRTSSHLGTRCACD